MLPLPMTSIVILAYVKKMNGAPSTAKLQPMPTISNRRPTWEHEHNAEPEDCACRWGVNVFPGTYFASLSGTNH